MKSSRKTVRQTALTRVPIASLPLAPTVTTQSQLGEPEKFLTNETLAEEFKKRGLPFPHRNSLLLAEKQLRFPKRFHMGGAWSRTLWRRSEIDAFFLDIVEERPAHRWKPRAELERESDQSGGAS
jgi:hypothetical protein